MEKKGTRLFQQGADTHEHSWNIVELEFHRQLRQKVNELLVLSKDPRCTTSEMQQHLLVARTRFGHQLTTQLVRSLQCNDPLRRQHIIWLLTLLNDQESILLLQHMSHNEQLCRPVRLSASLALAGMGATPETSQSAQSMHLNETTDDHKRVLLYAIH